MDDHRERRRRTLPPPLLWCSCCCRPIFWALLLLSAVLVSASVLITVKVEHNRMASITPAPTTSPTPAPTGTPTATPTAAPTAAPTPAPTAAPTAAPTPAPTTLAPTASPTCGLVTPTFFTTPPRIQFVDTSMQLAWKRDDNTLWYGHGQSGSTAPKFFAQVDTTTGALGPNLYPAPSYTWSSQPLTSAAWHPLGFWLMTARATGTLYSVNATTGTLIATVGTDFNDPVDLAVEPTTGYAYTVHPFEPRVREFDVANQMNLRDFNAFQPGFGITGVNGIAWRAATQQMYVMWRRAGQSTSAPMRLGTINLATGEITESPCSYTGRVAGEITIDNQDRMWLGTGGQDPTPWSIFRYDVI